MIYIAHRGNFNGPDPSRENTVPYIEEALQSGFNVEIDVWNVRGIWYLGHDMPAEKVEIEWLEKPGLWLHAKNIETFKRLRILKLHYFFHTTEAVVLTSWGIPWYFPCKDIHGDGVNAMPELNNLDPLALARGYGLCSDYVAYYRLKGRES